MSYVRELAASEHPYPTDDSENSQLTTASDLFYQLCRLEPDITKPHLTLLPDAVLQAEITTPIADERWYLVIQGTLGSDAVCQYEEGSEFTIYELLNLWMIKSNYGPWRFRVAADDYDPYLILLRKYPADHPNLNNSDLAAS